ncbi:alpha/beta hydrolase [Rhodohalobacter sp.]|uniref:alpha/beta hydrolase n=1 Tax=Rhodohalobacter sp. TaxID=1974210 RepID=UPI002ACD6C1E|nr:alpha/beta hydrolase-fold protein [Rhodohalobacter sp.]MDZ7758247.1 alpha/beta hydrolase-fold protein [Rhodohalobacter sp.]
MKNTILIVLFTGFLVQCASSDKNREGVEYVEKVQSAHISGHLDRYLFKPDDLTERFVDVWIPESYQPDTEYSVIYMHDGQMLFDKSSTWNSQEWRVDETLTRMMKDGGIPPTLVVGIWNADDQRTAEYFPEDALSYIDGEIRNDLLSNIPEEPRANRYVDFIAESVIPFVEENYPVKKNRAGRFMAGSSYGGLITIYTLTKYPELFSGVAALSTHWPGAYESNDEIPDAIREYLSRNLPEPGSHKIYFDHGTETLDSLYAPYQQKVDAMMVELGFRPDQDFKSEVFEGTNHSENAWAGRFEIPVRFLLNQKE